MDGAPLLAAVTGVIGKDSSFSLSTPGFADSLVPFLFGKLIRNHHSSRSRAMHRRRTSLEHRASLHRCRHPNSRTTVTYR